MRIHANKYNFTVGGHRGRPISKAWNPVLFLAAASACVFGAALCLVVGTIFLAAIPLSWVFTIKMTHE